MSNQADVQDEFLRSLAREKTLANVYLVSGIRLSGHLVAFDTYAVMLESASGRQLVFKHAISTVMPDTGDRASRPIPEAAGKSASTPRAQHKRAEYRRSPSLQAWFMHRTIRLGRICATRRVGRFAAKCNGR
ncbi:RNA chaperone Hfq [Paraburkholderia sediminicola]|uniref:RNA chaperone Hfq n=1 Tax=Paraburkholderia sediminicola TaxID=458836 RepID=UPI0038BB8916